MKKLVTILGIFVLASGCITINVNVPGSQQGDIQTQNSNPVDTYAQSNEVNTDVSKNNVNSKEDAIYYYKKGGDCIDNKDYKNAKYYFKKAIEIDPNYYNATVALALAELQLGKYNSAKEYALKAIELNYTQCYAYVVLAAAQSKLGEYRDAYSTLSVAYKYANESEKGKIYDMQTAIATKIQ